MGMFDKMLDVMGLGDDDEYYEEDEFDTSDDQESKSFFGKKNDDYDDYDDEPVQKRRAPKPAKITPMRSSKRGMGSMEVCVIKPTSFEDSREIIETLLDDHTVILNMEGLDLGLAQRIIDVTSGACLAIDGTLQKISNYIFIITPSSVELSGDVAALVDAFDIAGIQASF